MKKIRIVLVGSALVLYAHTARTQDSPRVADTSSSATAAAELLTRLDQLIEKNQQLEKQNRELIDEISALRQLLAQPVSASPLTSHTE